jgi:hypothetical protein
MHAAARARTVLRGHRWLSRALHGGAAAVGGVAVLVVTTLAQTTTSSALAMEFVTFGDCVGVVVPFALLHGALYLESIAVQPTAVEIANTFD